MSGQHTPGPWRVTETFVQHRRAIGWAEGTVAYVAVSDEDETELADARLIAAAPELLKAVLAVVDATRAYLPPDGIDAQECLSRVLAATDNPTITPIILEAENG